MTNKFLLSPLEKDDTKIYLRSYPVPTTVVEFEKFQLIKKTFDKKWFVEINESENEFLEVVITDGLHRKNTVQIFTKALKTIGCSCTEFKENFLGYCEHVAVLDRIIKGHIADKEQAVWHSFNRRFQALPPTRDRYRGRRYRVFIPLTREYVVVGRLDTETINSVGCPTVEFIDYKARYESFFDKNKVVTSAGLLKGVTLYDYQEDIFAKMLAAERCICSMIMGSGKTITSIAAYEWLRQNERKDMRMLIIAPKSLKLQWGSEISRTIGLDTVQINNLKDAERFKESNGQICAVTYQFISRHIEMFKSMNFDMIILDEMQYIRNDETKTWKAISKIQAKYMFGLSGTIIENRLEDLYSVMEVLAPGLLGPKWKFSSDYQNISSINKTSVFFEGTKNIEVLRYKLKHFLFSYHKLVLPALHHRDHMITLNNRERMYHNEYYDQAKILMAKMMTSGLSASEKIWLQTLLLKSRQSTDSERLITKSPTNIKSGKLEKLMSMLSDICEYRREKVVIFSTWTEMLDIISEHIKAELPGIGCTFFTGAESLKARKKSIDTFINDKNCYVFLASDAGGLGVDGLQYAATNVIHFELPWNPAKIDQRNARLHRIGQKKEVFSHYLIGEDSVETQMMETLYKKRAVRNEVLYHEDQEIQNINIITPTTTIVTPAPEPIKSKPRLLPMF